MIESKTAHFKCDFCGRKGQGEIEETFDEGPLQLRTFLPPKWRGDTLAEHSCRELCEARFYLNRAQEKIEILLKAQEGESP